MNDLRWAARGLATPGFDLRGEYRGMQYSATVYNA